jgi:hypothetical protein
MNRPGRVVYMNQGRTADMEQREPLIPPHGGYRSLKTFQFGRLIYDISSLAGDFEKRGGFTERLYRACSAGRRRRRDEPSDR